MKRPFANTKRTSLSAAKYRIRFLKFKIFFSSLFTNSPFIVSCQVMRFDTVYSILQSKERDRVPEIKTAFSKEIIGTVVLTRYNNRTYRIDDVRFDLSPRSTFRAGDKDISFIEYYKERYNLKINDTKQPLLVSNPKVSHKFN